MLPVNILRKSYMRNSNAPLNVTLIDLETSNGRNMLRFAKSFQLGYLLLLSSRVSGSMDLFFDLGNLHC